MSLIQNILRDESHVTLNLEAGKRGVESTGKIVFSRQDVGDKKDEDIIRISAPIINNWYKQL